MNGQILSPSAYRPSTVVDFEDTVAWWSSLSILGALLVVAGILVGVGRGEVVAISGVGLFFATAVLAGVELTEGATALGVAGVVWTAAGISVALGTDPSLKGSLVGFVLVGVAAVGVGVLGSLRARARSGPTGRPDPSS